MHIISLVGINSRVRDTIGTTEWYCVSTVMISFTEKYKFEALTKPELLDEYLEKK